MGKVKAGTGKGAGSKLRKTHNPVKWRKLRHKGPQFHPSYKRLGVQLFKYRNKIVKLSKPSEEVVVMYSKYLLKNQKPRKIFRENFFKDWREKYMSPKERQLITNFDHCNFMLVKNYLKTVNERRKRLSNRHRATTKREKEEAKKKFSYASINGKKEQISNFMVEPPGLYMGRGDNKNMGRIKSRVEPTDVTINCSPDCRPRPPPGSHWKAIVHDQKKMWFACYKDSITDKMKYIFPHASSTIKSKSDQEKFDKANELNTKIVQIRAKYRRHLNHASLVIRQHATAVYFLDNLAIRIGNEKNPGETDTVGCCTLRVEHLKLLRPASKREIQLRFFGKDSIPFERKKVVIKSVFRNLSEFLKRGNTQKKESHLIFDEITPKSLNEYLEGNMMDGLTAKVFRTFKATECYRHSIANLSRNLRKTDDVREIRMAHLKANMDVAKLLNHMTMATTSKKAKQKGLQKHQEKLESMMERYDGIRRKRLLPDSEEYEEREKIKWDLQILEDELKIKKDRTTWVLATSLINYIDPRVVKNWCDSFELDIKYVYSKAQVAKFRWALEGSHPPSSRRLKIELQ